MDGASTTADKMQPYANAMQEQYELSEVEISMTSGIPTHSTLSANQEVSEEATFRIALDEGVTVQELAPMDHGVRAWTFCCCAFVLETMIWGFCFRWVLDWMAIGR